MSNDATATKTDTTKFTVFIRQADGTGTTYITSVEAADIEQAKQAALEECSQDWSVNGSPWAIDDLTVIGVARGEFEILEWDDVES